MTTQRIVNVSKPCTQNIQAWLTIGLMLLLLTGCASKAPTFSDNVAKEGDQYKAISKSWAAGQEMIAKGKKRIKKGQKQVRDGNKNISEGEKMMLRGSQMMQDSERDYKVKKAIDAPD